MIYCFSMAGIMMIKRTEHGRNKKGPQQEQATKPPKMTKNPLSPKNPRSSKTPGTTQNYHISTIARQETRTQKRSSPIAASPDQLKGPKYPSTIKAPKGHQTKLKPG